MPPTLSLWAIQTMLPDLASTGFRGMNSTSMAILILLLKTITLLPGSMPFTTRRPRVSTPPPLWNPKMGTFSLGNGIWNLSPSLMKAARYQFQGQFSGFRVGLAVPRKTLVQTKRPPSPPFGKVGVRPSFPGQTRKRLSSRRRPHRRGLGWFLFSTPSSLWSSFRYFFPRGSNAATLATLRRPRLSFNPRGLSAAISDPSARWVFSPPFICRRGGSSAMEGGWKRTSILTLPHSWDQMQASQTLLALGGMFGGVLSQERSRSNRPQSMVWVELPSCGTMLFLVQFLTILYARAQMDRGRLPLVRVDLLQSWIFKLAFGHKMHN